VKDSWIAKVGMVLVALLVVWNIYKGVTVQEIGFPGFTFKFGTSVGPSALAGSWKYEMFSDDSHQTYTGYMYLTADSNLITGEMDNPDPLNKGEKSPLRGTYTNGTLVLTRTYQSFRCNARIPIVPQRSGVWRNFSK
jgi:hypothetical protein